MMTADKDGISIEHDTTMCGDPKIWFPMRVTYSRELKVKAELDRLEIENFVPMRYKMVDDGSEIPRRDLVPAINNLIFVRSTQERISGLKASNEVLEGVASVAIAFVPAVMLKEILNSGGSDY